MAEPAFTLALQKFERANRNLEKRIAECENQQNTVPSSAFKPVNLTETELKIALLVLHNREDACDEAMRGKSLIALSIYKTLPSTIIKPLHGQYPTPKTRCLGTIGGDLNRKRNI